MLRKIHSLCLVCLCALPALAETPRSAGTDVDPAALQVLKAVTDSLKNAKTYSFRARVARDQLGTNDQAITLFQDERVTVSRPDKVRADIDGEHKDVQLYFDGNAFTLYEPDGKLYVSMPAKMTIDQMIDTLEKRGVQIAIADVLQADPYPSLVDGLKTAYVIGRVNMFGKTFHHLAFTENDVDWQLWVEPGDKPLPRRLEIVYKKKPGSPRVVVDFTDWNLSAQADPSMFTFAKPEGARQIDFLPQMTSKEK